MRGGILLAVALGALALTAWQLVPRSDGPSVIGRVDIDGAERLDPSVIRSQSGLDVGMPWTSDARVRAVDALTRLPQVQSVQVDSVPSASSSERIAVRIGIRERRPYGVVELDDGERRWVDVDGIILGRVDRQPPSLPVITGLRTEPSANGPRLQSESGIRVMRSFYALSGQTLRRFASLRVREYDLTLQMREGLRALLPPDRLHDQIERLERVVATLRVRGEPDWDEVGTIDLRAPGEVVIGQ